MGAAIAAASILEWILVDAADERLAVWLIASVGGVLAIGVSHPVASRWPLGALLWLPVAWYASEAALDPTVRWHPYSWWSSTWAWAATLLLLPLRQWILAFLEPRVAGAWRAVRSGPWVTLLAAAAVAGTAVTAITPRADGIAEWSEFVRTVTSEDVLVAEREAVARDPSTQREIQAPALVHGARLVQMPSGVGADRPELLRECETADDGVAVLVELDQRTAYLPLPDRGITACSRVHADPLLRLSDAGFVGPVGASRVTALLLALGTLVSCLLLVAWRRAKARLARLRETHEAVVIRDRSGSGSTVRLDDGTVVQLPDGVSVSARYVLVLLDGERRIDSYRLDPRRHSHGFAETDDPREVCLGNAVESVKRWEALVLVTLAFLAMPAVLAWSRGLVVSLW